MAGDGIGAENVRRKRVELRRRVSEEVGEGDGRERVRVGVRGAVCENHFDSDYASRRIEIAAGLDEILWSREALSDLSEKVAENPRKRALKLTVLEKDEKSAEKINCYHNDKQATII